MIKKKQVRVMGYISISLFFAIVFCRSTCSWAFSAGTTYDKSNVQEIKDLLIPAVLNWVENDGWIIKTGKLNFELKFDDAFMNASKQNAGKYEVNENGLLVLKADGKVPENVYGLAFPTINPNEAMAGQKVLENHKLQVARQESAMDLTKVNWIGTRGFERTIVVGNNWLHYIGRKNSLPNPDNYYEQAMTFVVEPFDLRGTIQMQWVYNTDKEDVSFAYIPMLRRIRRMSAATRSDPFLGSDLCMDENVSGWFGKNSSMKWKVLGTKDLLSPWTSVTAKTTETYPDGSISKVYDDTALGSDKPGWTGVPWADVGSTWVQRPVWIVEGIPKDPYYNYGKEIFYVDKGTYALYFKEIFSWAGEYWKGVYLPQNYYTSEDGRVWHGLLTFIEVIDEKTHHCTAIKQGDVAKGQAQRFYIPLSRINPGYFTETNMRQLTK